MDGKDNVPDDPEFPGVEHPFEVPEGLTPPDPSEFAAGPPPNFSPPPTGQPPSGQPPSGQPPSGPPQFPPPDQSLGAPPTGFPSQAAPPPGSYAPPPGSYASPSGFPAPAGGGQVMVEKKKRGCLFWGLIATGVLVLLVGGCSFLLFQAGSDATAAGNDFLGLVRDGNYDAAADSQAQQTPAGTQCDIDPGQLEQDFAGLSDFTIFGIGFGGEGGVGGQVTINGDQTDVALALVEESGVWKVCQYDVGDGAEVEIGN